MARGCVGGVLGAVLLLAALLPTAGLADDSDVSPVTVRLEATGRTAVPQGAPLHYRAVLTNPTSEVIATTLTVGIEHLGTGKALWFKRTTRSAAPGETTIGGWATPSQWLAERGSYRVVVRTSGGHRDSLRFGVTSPNVRVPRFRDVTDEVGLTARHHIGTTCNGTHAAGAAWGDVEGDGDLDLYLPDQTDPARLWVRQGARFVERAMEAGVDNGGREGYGAVFADYDNDGDQDLFVVNDGADRLYRNDGSGRFSDVAPQAGLADALPGTSAAWGDYDGDGNLDLYVSRWGRCNSKEYLHDTLYRSNGDGTFSDRTALLQATGHTDGRGFIGGWLDYDGDSDLDLYLANDFAVGPTPKPNVLWRNDGPAGDGSWTFANASAESGTGIAMNSMGLGVGDYNRDIDLDLAISNIGPNVLFDNGGDGTFEDRAHPARVARPVQRLVPSSLGLVPRRSITWGLGFGDLNGDGWEDLYAAAGSMGTDATQPNELYVNAGNGRFLDLSAPSGAADPESSRGVAFADYDRDGRLDLYVVNRGGHPRLYRNVTDPSGLHWLAVDTVGTVSNRDGCGAQVVAVVGNARLLRQVSCGSTSLSSGSDSTVHFGLGGPDTMERLRIEWPSGIVQRLRDVAADRLITVREPRR